MKKFFIVVTMCALAASSLVAAPITISFGSDTINETNSINGVDKAVVPVTGIWATAPPPYEWVSYDAQTGSGGTAQPSATAIPGPPTVTFFETLVLGASFGSSSMGTVTVFADDTAGIRLINSAHPGTGILLRAPNPVQDTRCAAGPVGCEFNEGYTALLNGLLTSGTNMIAIDAYQRVDATPFAGMWYGSVTDTQVPEPISLSLIGTGLVGIAILRRRKTFKASKA